MTKNLESKTEKNMADYLHHTNNVGLAAAALVMLGFVSYHLYDNIRQFYQKPLKERIEIRKQMDKEFSREISKVYHNNSIVALVRPGY
jgi:hypothetical protein